MMRDFTLTAYKQYLEAIKHNYPHILHFAEFLELEEKPDSWCLIRHDVDRKPSNALTMAQIENEMDVAATYYFRAKRHTFKPEVLGEISRLGHEIGYHYESLSDTDGDYAAAIEDFKENLKRFREYCEVKTVSMHGRPLKSIDNRALWRDPSNYHILKEELGLLGEIYLEIDYTTVAYINDTGRNWSSESANIRDVVNSDIEAHHDSGEELLQTIERGQYPKMVFQIHPERWEERLGRWSLQWGFDISANLAKRVLTVTGRLINGRSERSNLDRNRERTNAERMQE